MECGQAPKILRLALHPVFVPFLCPFFIHYLSRFSFFLLLFLQAFKGQLAPRLHITYVLAALIIPGGFFHRTLIIYLGLVPGTCVMLPHVPFFAIICIDKT